jgi:hypothetical protein
MQFFLYALLIAQNSILVKSGCYMGGARLAVTEGEGVVAGLRKLEVETTFDNYAKAAQAEMGRARARWPAVRSGPAQARLGRVGRILRKKFFSNKN